MKEATNPFHPLQRVMPAKPVFDKIKLKQCLKLQLFWRGRYEELCKENHCDRFNRGVNPFDFSEYRRGKGGSRIGKRGERNRKRIGVGRVR